MVSAQEIYSQSVMTLPPSERLRLANLILEGLAESASALDYSESWSEQDMQDLAAFSATYLDDAVDKE